MFSPFLTFLFVFLAMTTAQEWSNITETGKKISAKGQELWMVKSNQAIYRWNGSDWERMPGKATSIGVSPDGYAWALDGYGNVSRWNIVQNKWESVPKPRGEGITLLQINAISKDLAICAERSGDIWLYRYKGNSWKKIGQNIGWWASAGENGGLWAISSRDGSIRSWERGSWISKPSPYLPSDVGRCDMFQIEVYDPSRVIVNNCDKAYMWQGTGWKLLDMPISDGPQSVGINGTHIFAVDPPEGHTSPWDMDGPIFQAQL